MFYYISNLENLVIFISWYVALDVIAENPTYAVKNTNGNTQNFCKTKKFQQALYIRDCGILEFENNFCFGQCDSKYTLGFDASTFRCSTCRPTMVQWSTKQMKCSNNETKGVKVQIYPFCQCTQTACKDIKRDVSVELLYKPTKLAFFEKIKLKQEKQLEKKDSDGLNEKNKKKRARQHKLKLKIQKLKRRYGIKWKVLRATRRLRKCRQKEGKKKRKCLNKWRKEIKQENSSSKSSWAEDKTNFRD